jgi:hypothetical protein
MSEEQKVSTEPAQEDQEDIVTGTQVVAASDKGIDYDKLVDKFGCSRMTPELIQKV